MTFEEVLNKFQARRSGSGWMARCPFHEDGTASLSITQENGLVLLHCHAGCRIADVLGAAGLTFEDLRQEKRIVATYDYENEKGELLYQVVRFDPKSFAQRKPTQDGGWEWNLNGVRRVLYRLPELMLADSVTVTEGEKDADALRAIGITATTNVSGAGKWKDEYSECFRAKRVVIAPDRDEAGRKHSQQVAASIAGKAASVAICEMPEGFKDVSEFLARCSKEALLDLLAKATLWTPGAQLLELFHTPDECLNAPEITFAIDKFLQNEGVTFVGGLSGHAKTWLMLSVAKALLAGEGTNDSPRMLWDTFRVNETASRVVYLIPEVGLSSFMSRIRRMRLLPFIQERRLLVRTLSKGRAPDLDDPLLLAAAKDSHIILDTAARFADGEENSASDNARGLAADIFGLIAAGARTVICAHHSPKAFLKETVMSLEAILRGTGDIGAMATSVWGTKQLNEPDNIVYIECVKARDFQHCEPFQLRGRPQIDETGDFMLYREPGESGSLAEESPNVTNRAKKQERDERVNMVRHWLTADPNMTAPEMVAKFAERGITVDDATVRRYRIAARKAC
ncbi:MAG: AAA family ATPase [Candidatus Acidiferrum sp.]